MSIFYHGTSVWKIFATVFVCFIAGECHGSVNIWSCSYWFYTLCGIFIFDWELLFILVLHTMLYFEVLFEVIVHIGFTHYVTFLTSIGSCCSYLFYTSVANWYSIWSCCSYWFYTLCGKLMFYLELLFVLVLHTMWHFDVEFWSSTESCCLYLFYTLCGTLMFFLELLFILVLHTMWHFDVLFGVVVHIGFTHYVSCDILVLHTKWYVVFWSLIGSCCSYWFYTLCGTLMFFWSCCSYWFYTLCFMWHIGFTHHVACGILIFDWEMLFILVLHTMWPFDILFGVFVHISFTHYVTFWSSIESCCSCCWCCTSLDTLMFSLDLFIIMVLQITWHFDLPLGVAVHSIGCFTHIVAIWCSIWFFILTQVVELWYSFWSCCLYWSHTRCGILIFYLELFILV